MPSVGICIGKSPDNDRDERYGRVKRAFETRAWRACGGSVPLTIGPNVFNWTFVRLRQLSNKAATIARASDVASEVAENLRSSDI